MPKRSKAPPPATGPQSGHTDTGALLPPCPNCHAPDGQPCRDYIMRRKATCTARLALLAPTPVAAPSAARQMELFPALVIDAQRREGR